MRLNTLLLGILSLLVASTGQQESGECGVGTYLDHDTLECRCRDSLDQEDPNVIRLAGIFDTATYDWAHDIFEVTVQLLKDGWWDVLPSNTRLVYHLENSDCDESQAMKSYWKLRTQNDNKPMHGIIGARCSGASMALARLAGLEGVPQVSPASNSAVLSNAEEFPYFSRLLAPNDERGEVGAMVALLRAFGWDRIGIIATDTQFAKDSVTAFKKAWLGEHDGWSGEVAYSDTVRITPDGMVDDESVRQVLDHIPTKNPLINSRVIVLFAHSEHALPILEFANITEFQPDTIWVGPSSWVGKDDLSRLPQMPGYLGVAPFRNRDSPHYQQFMDKLQSYQQSEGRPVLYELPTFAAETVDAIRALTTAIVASTNRRAGQIVVRELRGLEFEGVSGPVEFTPIGDRKNPNYSIFNAQPIGDGTLSWVDIGTTGTEDVSAFLTNGMESVYFADVGDGLSEAPDDMYPTPPYKLPGWAIFLIVVLALVLVALIYVLCKYWASRQSKRAIRAELESFRESVVGLRAGQCKYIPQIGASSGDIEQGGRTNNGTALWMWKETKTNMKLHAADEVYGDPKDCWILYTAGCSRKLEKAYQKGQAKLSPLPGYVVDLKNFEQTKSATGFKRDVQRKLDPTDEDPSFLEVSEIKDELNLMQIEYSDCLERSELEQRLRDARENPRKFQQKKTKKDVKIAPGCASIKDVETGDALPRDLQGEPQMVFCEKDIIQISGAKRSDGWAFGTKLHQADEATSRQLLALALNGANEDEGSVCIGSGWFQFDKTRVPTAEDLAVVQQNVGDAGALKPPSFWAKVSDPAVVQKHELDPGDGERLEVENAFLSSLDRSKVQVQKVERVQNLAMWQTYVVKRQTVCSREFAPRGSTSTQQDAVHKKALQRYEKKWLFHGTNCEVMDKILQQGFNRSFCGKNATMFGKGVYFARDAKYSAATLYSVPDRKGRQYIMACRVVVGEYCRGQKDALTPDIRLRQSQTLYDSTVNNMSDPSIYVTYHDAQAYPEYLITFKQQ